MRTANPFNKWIWIAGAITLLGMTGCETQPQKPVVEESPSVPMRAQEEKVAGEVLVEVQVGRS